MRWQLKLGLMLKTLDGHNKLEILKRQLFRTQALDKVITNQTQRVALSMS